MTGLKAFEILPKSEHTVIKHHFQIGNLRLINNLGYPCLYAIFDKDENKEIGIVQYYKGAKLCLREART